MPAGLEEHPPSGQPPSVRIRRATPADAPLLVAGRDAEFHRFLGTGDEVPQPFACIVLDGAVIGWVDFDAERSWLEPGEVNVGYHLFEDYRGRGYATAAVRSLLEHLARRTAWRTATRLIAPENERSLALANRLGFVPWGDIDGNRYWKRAVS